MQAPFRDITITRAKIYDAIFPLLSLSGLSLTAKNIMQVMTFDGNDEKRKKKVLNDAEISSRTTKARSLNSIYRDEIYSLYVVW